MNILGILDVGVITGALRAIGAFLCNWIYDLIAKIYELFMTVSRLNILSSEEIGPIYQRVTMILTIVMVFYITFEFVKFVVEPDGITDKNKGVGNIVTRMIIVVVLIAFVPRIFSLAYELQNKIIENQVISKVILGKTNSEFSTFGNQFSADVLSLFYSVDEENCGNKCEDAKIVVDSNLERLRNGSNLKLGSSINETVKQDVDGKKEEVPIINFQGLTAIIVGGFIVYILIMYSIDVGIRYAQLIFLQIISPIAIMGYLSPKKDNMFQKWGKQCISTYLDLFIRISLIYFVLLIIETLGNAYNSGSLFEGLEGISGSMRVFTYIVLIMGLLAFAQRAPKLLSNLIPSLGGSGIGFGISAKDRISPTTGAFKKAGAGVRAPINVGRRALGTATGAAIGIGTAFKNRKNIGTNNGNKFTKGLNTAYSAAKAGGRGAIAGMKKGGSISKANAAARQSVQKDVSIADKGGTVLGHDFLGGHYQQKSVETQRDISGLEDRVKAKESVASTVKEMKVMKTINSYKEDWDQQSIGDASARTGAIKSIEKAARVYAISDKSPASENALKDTIKAAVDKVYLGDEIFKKIKAGQTLTQEEQKLVNDTNTARKQTVSSLEANLEIGSVKWNTVAQEIQEAYRISVGQKYTTEENGKLIEKTVEKSNDEHELAKNITEFAKNIGDVADSATDQAREKKFDPNTKRAQANSSGDKK